MKFALAILLFLATPASAEEICASKLSELEKSERLRTVKPLFAAQGVAGLLNQTNGTYVLLTADEQGMTARLYTSGLFDMYPIKRESALEFCDTGEELKMIGLGRSERIHVENGRITLGGGGPRLVFAPGRMPEKLRLLHGLKERDIAARVRP